MDTALLIVVVVAVIYQLWVSALVVSAPEYDTGQKMWQIVFVWLVMPLLAALVVHAMLLSDRAGPRKRDTAFIRNDEGGGNNAG